MLPPPIFLPAHPRDILAMSKIRLAVTENALRDPSRITQQMYEDYLELLGRGWVAEVDGEITGFCYADNIQSSIGALFMSPKYEGKGHALAVGNAIYYPERCMTLAPEAKKIGNVDLMLSK